jgi:hypothetical protein
MLMKRALRRAVFPLTLLLLWVVAASGSVQAQGGLDPAEARAAAKAQAGETARAFAEGNYEKLIDYTYPRVVEMFGGREKMLAGLRDEVKKMRDDGFEFISYEASEAGEPVALPGGKLTAVIVPAVLKMKGAGRLFSQESYLVGVSADGGRRWTFISGSSLNEERLRLILPEAGGKLTLPKEGELKVETQQ